MTKTNHGNEIPALVNPWPSKRDVMLYPSELQSSNERRSFHCEDCGANVFREVEPKVYACNGCGARYKGFR